MTTEDTLAERLSNNFAEGAKVHQSHYLIYRRNGVPQLEMTLSLSDAEPRKFKGPRTEGLSWLQEMINATTSEVDRAFLAEKHTSIANHYLPTITVREPVAAIQRTIVTTPAFAIGGGQ